MCSITDPVRFLIGQHDEWSAGLTAERVEELETRLRRRVFEEFAAIPDLEWVLRRSDLSRLPDELAKVKELPHDAHRHFIDHQLERINAKRPKSRHVWYGTSEGDDLKCCFRDEHGWYPCAMYKLYVGDRKARKRYAVRLEDAELKEPIDVPLWVQVSWRNLLSPPDEDEQERERIVEILPRASGARLKKALALLEGTKG